MDMLDQIRRFYMENRDTRLYFIIIVSILVIYFISYMVSFFFKLPVIIILGTIIGYFIYSQDLMNRHKRAIRSKGLRVKNI